MGERDILPTMFIHTSLLSASLIGRQCVRCDAFLQLAAIYTTNERNKWRFFSLGIHCHESIIKTDARMSDESLETRNIKGHTTTKDVSPYRASFTNAFIYMITYHMYDTEVSYISVIYINIYIYIKWTVFVNVTTKSAQHAHERMIVIIVGKSPNSSHIYDYGFMDNANRQTVKNWLNSQTSDASLTSWRQPFCKFIKWLPPWRKGRITCLKP